MRTKSPKKTNRANSLSADEHLEIQEHIRRRAHEFWLDGGTRTGHDLSDWIQAEQEVLALHVAVHTQSSLNRRPPPQRFDRVTTRWLFVDRPTPFLSSPSSRSANMRRCPSVIAAE